MEIDAGLSGNWLENDEDDIGADDVKGEERMVVNPTYVRERIDHALEILSDFKNRRNKSKSRAEIIEEFSRDLSEYYGYLQELSDLFLELFSPSECVEFMDASDKPRPLVIRTNTIKTTRKDLMDALSKRGVAVEAIEWSKVAIKVTESTVPIGATPEYLAGHYILQSAASLNPVMALDPQPGERILDMSSAPGGKTSYVAQLMKNSGTVMANDLKVQRQKATVANLHRMGVKNAIVCCMDGRKVPNIMKGFDRVLLDAPCSGLGVIARDQTVKLQRTLKDIQRNAHLQKELLCAAVDAVDHKSMTGGIVVYSTCSVSTEENEQVVEYILHKRHVRLIDTGLEVGRPGYTRYQERRFHPSMTLTRRFYPHVHNMDGFFVAKFKKYASGVKSDDANMEAETEEYGDEMEEEREVNSSNTMLVVNKNEIKEEVVEMEVEKNKGKSKGKKISPKGNDAAAVPASKNKSHSGTPIASHTEPTPMEVIVEKEVASIETTALKKKQKGGIVTAAPSTPTVAADVANNSNKNIKQSAIKEMKGKKEETPTGKAESEKAVAVAVIPTVAVSGVPATPSQGKGKDKKKEIAVITTTTKLESPKGHDADNITAAKLTSTPTTTNTTKKNSKAKEQSIGSSSNQSPSQTKTQTPNKNKILSSVPVKVQQDLRSPAVAELIPTVTTSSSSSSTNKASKKRSNSSSNSNEKENGLGSSTPKSVTMGNSVVTQTSPMISGEDDGSNSKKKTKKARKEPTTSTTTITTTITTQSHNGATNSSTTSSNKAVSATAAAPIISATSKKPLPSSTSLPSSSSSTSSASQPSLKLPAKATTKKSSSIQSLRERMKKSKNGSGE